MEKLITGIVFVCIGLLLFFNNKNIAKGAAQFYQKFYTENNLKNLFRALGVILLLAGLVLIFFSNYL